MRELTTARDVVAELGGLEAVAKLTARKYSAVSNWPSKSFNKFPANTFLVMQKALEQKGCTAPISLWNMVPAEEEQAVS